MISHKQKCKLYVENNETFLLYDGLKMVYEGRSYPGGGHLDRGQYDEEIQIFSKILENIKNEKPLMIEVGSHWAFWSLMFRTKFPNGKNVIIDIGKEQLSIGVRNFELNNYDVTSYHGAFFREHSETYEKKDTQLKAGVGENLDFFQIYKSLKTPKIDLLHMDIQGSELVFMENILPFLDSKIVQNFVICTHDHLVQPLHKKIVSLLKNYKYNVHIDINSLNYDDGYIYASIT